MRWRSPRIPPSAEPSVTPDAGASTEPSTEPGAQPTKAPGTEPGNPGASAAPQETTGKALAKGTVFTAGKLKYKVTGDVPGKVTEAVQGPKSKKAKSLTIPAAVIVLFCCMVLTFLGCYPCDSAIRAEAGFYRLYYEEPVMIIGVGRRSAGQQSPKVEITAYSGTDTEIVIPGIIDGNEVKSIGRGAFKGNPDITHVTIAEGITSIGYDAFSGCEKLAAVSIPSTVINWNDTSSNNYDSRAFENLP